MKRAPGNLRVASLNIWFTSGRYSDRFAIICDAVQDLDPDVLCLQEVIHSKGASQLVDIAQHTGLTEMHFAESFALDGAPFGNAILSKLHIQSMPTIALDSAPLNESRVACVGRVQYDETPILIASVHLTHRLWASAIRQRQVLQLHQGILETKSGDDFLVLSGDFNAPEVADEIRFLRGECAIDSESTFYQDAYRQHNADPGYTYSNLNPYAALAFEPDRRIDYIFVSQAENATGRFRTVASGLFADEPDRGIWASDHFGVWADIVVSPFERTEKHKSNRR